MSEYETGAVIECKWPLTWCLHYQPQIGPGHAILGWRAGVFPRDGDGGSYQSYTEWDANGEGVARFTVISVHKPGKYPARVFYTREFVSPDNMPIHNKERRLHICSVAAFKKRVEGWPYSYDVYDDREEGICTEEVNAFLKEPSP